MLGDIITVEGEVFREVTAKFKGGKKSTRVIPIKYTARLNAMSILLAAGGVLSVSFALWWSQMRLQPLTLEQKKEIREAISSLEVIIAQTEQFINMEKLKPKEELDLEKIRELTLTLANMKKELRGLKIKLTTGVQLKTRLPFIFPGALGELAGLDLRFLSGLGLIDILIRGE